tara:strand:+ start:23 stop:553 length:531 start_codon:yes stop_codon:yes gene_type:complete
MSEDKVQEVAQEVTPDTKEVEPTTGPEVGEAIAESKKYRTRAQKAETKLAKIEKQLEEQRQDQLEKQEEWKTLADERKNKLAEQESELEVVREERARELEVLLSDFPETEREELKGLDLKSVRLIHSKIMKKPKVANVDGTVPTGDANVKLEDWTKLDPKVRRRNWSSIVDSFKNK